MRYVNDNGEIFHLNPKFVAKIEKPFLTDKTFLS